MFILGGLLTITYITITLPTEFPFGKSGDQITYFTTNSQLFMIVHLPTGKTFITQKDAKLYFGNHYYRRLVKKGDIYFTNYNSKVANDPIQKNN